MKMSAPTTFRFALLLTCLVSCNSGNSPDTSMPRDRAAIEKGEALFTQNCSGCHNFKQNSIGPQLGGITDEVHVDWIRRFITDPKNMIDAGDERAQSLYKKFNTAMPSFSSLTKSEVNNIIAFLQTRKKPGEIVESGDATELLNPIPDTIELSNLVIGLKLVAQIPASGNKGKMPLARITKLDYEPQTGSLFILDLRGKLYKLQNNRPVVYMDMARLKSKFINEPGLGTGFGSFAFHPDFVKNGLLYTTHTEAKGSGKADFSFDDSIKVALQWVLTEWKTSDPSAATFSGKGRELLRINMVDVVHGMQEITFNPLAKHGGEDYGRLYIGVGDGGSADQGLPGVTHGKDKVWGTILRIDPAGNNSLNGQYGIPSDNPFEKNRDSKSLGEIYAWGFRNPHRITWTKSGKLLASHIGGENIESLALVLPGHDYGWPIREGTFLLNPYGNINKVYPLPANDSIYHITYPIAQYDHDGRVSAISGGFEYEGTLIPQLKGKFLFGDIPSGKLFFIETADIKMGKQATIKQWKVSFNGTQKTLSEVCGNDRIEIRFGRDAEGELYLLTKADGKVYKLISASGG